MTELETALLRQLASLSNECKQQFDLQAGRLSDYEMQLSLQSQKVEHLTRLIVYFGERDR